MNGALGEGVLPGFLRGLYVERRTGLLHFNRDAERHSVRFLKGSIVHARTNVKEDRLGETLVRKGLLSAGDLKRATGFVLRDKKRLGQVLQQLGILDQDKLEDALALQVREILLKVFSWQEGSYAFEEQSPEAPVEDDLTLKLSTGEMILEAVRLVRDRDVVRYALGDIDRVLGQSTDPLLRFQKITLTPTDGYVVSRADGTLSARDILGLMPVPPEDTMRSLLGLLCTGTLEYLPVPPKKQAGKESRKAPMAQDRAQLPSPAAATVDPPAAVSQRPRPPSSASGPLAETPPSVADERKAPLSRRVEILIAYDRIKTKNHFDVLGIEPGANDAQVKEAYFRLAKRFHPDTHHDPTLADLRDQLEAVFIRLGAAYDVLRNPRTRAGHEAELATRAPRVTVLPAQAPRPQVAPEPEPPPATPLDPAQDARAVQEALRKAQYYLEKDKCWDAIQLLEPVLPLAQDKPLQRVRVLLSKAYLKNPKWVKQAEQMLQTVIREDPKNVEANFLLGTIYKLSGLRSRASHAFRRVLELEAEHEQANAQLAELMVAEEPARPTGLLRKILKKG